MSTAGNGWNSGSPVFNSHISTFSYSHILFFQFKKIIYFRLAFFDSKVLIAAAIGGTAEKLGGGKFANGAVTGAYVMMFNHMMHQWHPTREAAYSSAEANTISTGNETAVMVFVDEAGDSRYWECPPHPDNGPLKVKWVWPSDNDLEGLTLVEEFHFSPGRVNGNRVKGSYADWKNSQKHKITVTHISIGIGLWRFEYSPFYYFTQPFSLVFKEHRDWDRAYPIIP